MVDKFPPANQQRRRFQSLQSLLRSKAFVDAEGLAETPLKSETFSFPDLNLGGKNPATPNATASDLNQTDSGFDPVLPFDESGAALAGKSLEPESNQRVEGDLKDIPGDWIPKRERETGLREGASCCFKVMAAGSDELDPVAAQIENRFRGGTATVVLFASVDRFSDSKFIASALAVKLANRSTQRVLVIDSEFETGHLSAMQGMASNSGISDWIQTPTSTPIVQPTDHSRLDFVPAGNQSIECWKSAGDSLNHYLKSYSVSHSYICVNAGDAHGDAIRMWSQYCGGSYLAVDKKRSSRAVAESAVLQMRRYESRLLGCIIH